jgi:hypothetical protein
MQWAVGSPAGYAGSQWAEKVGPLRETLWLTGSLPTAHCPLVGGEAAHKEDEAVRRPPRSVLCSVPVWPFGDWLPPG